MKIRKARKGDLHGILNVFIDSAVLNPKDKGNKELKKYISFSIKDKDMLTLVSLINKKIIGVCICQLKELKKTDAKLLDIYILKKYRGERIGSDLLKKLSTILKNKSFENLGGYSENNKRTLNFYKKHGFEIGRLIRRCDKKLK